MIHYANRVDLRHLRYFVAIVRQGSFRAAAETLNISQPPLTRQIQQLEDILNTQLLIRNSSGVQTTDAGDAFFTDAQNILNLVDLACTNAALIGTGQMGRLDVGVFGSAVLDIIPRIVLHFRNLYPEVHVELHNMDRETQVKALQERRIQVGFNRFFLDYPDLIWESVADEKLHAAMPSTHRLAGKAMIDFEDLAQEQIIFYPRTSKPGGFSNYLLRQFHNAGVEPTIVQTVDDVVTAVSFVSSGLGITICVESSRSLRLPGVTYVPINSVNDAAFDLSVIYRAREESQLIQAFLASARTIAGRQQL